MTQIQKDLKEIIEGAVLPDIADYLDELFELVAAKKESEEDRKMIQEMQEMQQDFQEILQEIENNEIDDDECIDILEEIKAMIEGE